MAHFAQLDNNNTVVAVVSISDSDCGGGTGENIKNNESTGVNFCKSIYGSDTNWKLTVWTEWDDNTGFRGSYAGVGMTYMTGVKTLGVASTDIFIESKPVKSSPHFPSGSDSWAVGVNTARWEPPLPGCLEYGPAGSSLALEYRAAGQYYYWDEDTYKETVGSGNTVGWALSTGRGDPTHQGTL